MAALSRKEKRRIAKDLSTLTNEAIDVLGKEFSTLHVPPLEVICYTEHDVICNKDASLKEHMALYSDDIAYYNLSYCYDPVSWDTLHSIGEEVSHHLHRYSNIHLMPMTCAATKKFDIPRWLEGRNIEELVGYWGGCIFAQRKGGYDPRNEMNQSFHNYDDEHRVGYEVAARMLRAITPLRLHDFIHLHSWDDVELRCREYITLPEKGFVKKS